MADVNSSKKTVRLTDLRHPVLTELQKEAVMAAEAAPPVTFSVDAILSAAQEMAGLSDFGAEDFMERLAVWLRAIDEDENASAFSRANLFKMTLRYAVNRLRLENLVRLHPEILEIKIDRPIIVAGLPRSGTTHMLALLSADRRLRSLPWWEAIAPVPGPGDEPVAGDENPRHSKAAAGWHAFEALLPHVAIMHEFSADHISEDVELQALDFSSYLIEWLGLVPRWRDYYLSHDQTGPYAYLKKALQVLTFLKGPDRWVIKCPQHMEQLPVLYKTFPDATFVITHRDPVASIRSAMTMTMYTARVLRKRIDPAELANYWPDRYERLLRACVRDRDVLPEAQTIDVYFHEWIKNPDPILRDIYARADLPLTDAALADLHGYLAANEARDQAVIEYDLQGNFGLSAAEIRKSFGFYFQRFRAREEVK